MAMERNERPEVPACMLLDIDGTLLHHHGSPDVVIKAVPRLLPGVLIKMAEWARAGCRIILVTGRRECMRAVTERHLEQCGIVYDQLVMDAGTGTRILVNDMKPNGDGPTAVAVNLPRNRGLYGISVRPGEVRVEVSEEYEREYPDAGEVIVGPCVIRGPGSPPAGTH